MGVPEQSQAWLGDFNLDPEHLGLGEDVGLRAGWQKGRGLGSRF